MTGVGVDRVEELERALGIHFPQAIRIALAKRNRGRLEVEGQEWSLHPIWDPTDRGTIRRTGNHVVQETEVARKWRSFPSDGVSIAANGFGDHLIIRPGGSEVEFWDHETGGVFPVEITVIQE